MNSFPADFNFCLNISNFENHNFVIRQEKFFIFRKTELGGKYVWAPRHLSASVCSSSSSLCTCLGDMVANFLRRSSRKVPVTGLLRVGYIDVCGGEYQKF